MLSCGVNRLYKKALSLGIAASAPERILFAGRGQAGGQAWGNRRHARAKAFSRATVRGGTSGFQVMVVGKRLFDQVAQGFGMKQGPPVRRDAGAIDEALGVSAGQATSEVAAVVGQRAWRV